MLFIFSIILQEARQLGFAMVTYKYGAQIPLGHVYSGAIINESVAYVAGLPFRQLGY